MDGDSEEREPEEATVGGLLADGRSVLPCSRQHVIESSYLSPGDDSLGVIVGGVVGGVAMLLVVALVVLTSVYCLYRRRAQGKPRPCGQSHEQMLKL